MTLRCSITLFGAGIVFASLGCATGSGGVSDQAPDQDAGLEDAWSTGDGDGNGGGGGSGGSPSDAESDASRPGDPGDDAGTEAGGCPPEPPSSPNCAAQCTGGCFGDVCIIDCNAVNSCQGMNITCPDDFICQIECGAWSACQDTAFVCSDKASCRIQCTESSTCIGATMQCGAAECTAECTGWSSELAVDCGSSCSCSHAGCDPEA